MMLGEVNTVTQRYGPTNIYSGTEDEFRVCKGNFVGIVRPHDGQYEFRVRDMRREGHTVYGYGLTYSTRSLLSRSF